MKQGTGNQSASGRKIEPRGTCRSAHVLGPPMATPPRPSRARRLTRTDHKGATEMKDMEEIAGLLHLHKEAAAHGSGLSHIASAALTRLREINEELNPHKPSTHVQTAFDKEVPPRNVVPEPKLVEPKRELPPEEDVVERVPDGELKSEPTIVDESGEPIVVPESTPVVQRRDL
jgi:hypothetical protein